MERLFGRFKQDKAQVLSLLQLEISKLEQYKKLDTEHQAQTMIIIQEEVLS